MRKILLLLVVLQCLACADNMVFKDPKYIYKATYCNAVDADLHLALYNNGIVTQTYTIPALDNIILNLSRGFDPLILADSLYGIWGSKREFLWKDEALLELQLAQKKATLVNKYFLVYSFDFTREMYDAATPINTPAEE